MVRVACELICPPDHGQRICPLESTKNRIHILRLIENLTLEAVAVGDLTESMQGAGSPQAQEIMISRQVDMNQMQKSARRLCGIKEDEFSDS
jgi:4-hydroxybutyryl-CoA dehydratase/vinylacetyl-CoA-Delta-isomerase